MKDFTGIGELSKSSQEVFNMIYPDLLQPAVQKVGYALRNTIDFVTIPFTYLGYQSEKSLIYFERNLEQYKEKLDAHNEEEIGIVTPEVGSPIIEKLYTVTNEELAEMYTNLLVNASLIKKSKYAHPSFINVLQSINVDEARIIQYLIENNNPLLFVAYVKEKNNQSSYAVQMNNFYINLNDNIQLNYPEMADFYFLNLNKLGVLEQGAGIPEEVKNIVSEKQQEINEEKIKREQKANEDTFYSEYKVSDITGHYILTDYGKEFVKSIKR